MKPLSADSLKERLIVAGLALLATYAFFYEYLPPFKRVHVFSDIEGYHYPLQSYAFHSLKEGRFPQWDPSIYCGITFAGNLQAAVLYPPSWLMFAAGWRFPHLPFKTLEVFAFAHIWLGFVLCYLWLQSRRLERVASALGAAVFGFGGYMVSQMVHLGVVTGLAWAPLGFQGIDEAVDRSDWRPLWKTAVSSAMSFLAGYPANWLVCCSVMLVYALASRANWRATAGVCAALAASMLLAMAQVLPTMEATRFMLHGEKYGGGINSWRDLLIFFVPNWEDFNRHSPLPYPPVIYVYLGLPAIFGAAWALRRFRIRPYAQALAALIFSLLLATNPRMMVYDVLVHFQFLERILTSYTFYGGIALMAALFTALSLDDYLKQGSRRPAPLWAALAAIAMMAALSVWQLRLRRHGGTFASGSGAILQTAVAAAVFSVALPVMRASSGARRAILAAALVLMVAIDYKAFGSNRRFNTADGDPDPTEEAHGLRGMNEDAYRAIWENRHYRIASEDGAGPYSTDFRRWGLATPQGFDPFIPTQYHQAIEQWVPFRTNRVFAVDYKNEEMLQTLGVRFVITHQGVANDDLLAADPNFRLVGPDDSYYRVYEYRNARPPFGWADGAAEVNLDMWMPERRAFQVRSDRGGKFFLIEQYYPGWSATVDGRPAGIERWKGAFQAISVPPGEHTVVFEYHTRYLAAGTGISLAAIGGLVAIIVSDRRRRIGGTGIPDGAVP